jgi:CRP/FNR family cyclic AMP-dependent transcriptional regulator
MVNPNLFNEVPIFSLLDADERLVLAKHVSVRKFSKGHVIFRAGSPGGYAYLIQKGEVRVTITDASKEDVVVDMAREGGLIGMSSLLASENHITTAIATEDTTAIEIDRNDITTLLMTKPMAGLDMMTIVEKHLRSVHELVQTRASRNPNEEIEEQETLGQKLADTVARFGGSWTFITMFAVILISYTFINSRIPKPWDPYPFILLNLFLSMLAAIQAPIIMMSQNRQDAKDRVRSELDYRVNLKAELEIEELLQRIGDVEEAFSEKTRVRGSGARKRA